MQAFQARINLRQAMAAIEAALVELDGAIGQAGDSDGVAIDTEHGSVTIGEKQKVIIDRNKKKSLTEGDNINKSIERAWGKPPTGDACPQCGRSY